MLTNTWKGVTIIGSGACTVNPVLYLAPCLELVEGVGFIQDFCLAVVGTTTQPQK